MNTPFCRHCGHRLTYRGDQPVIRTVLALGDCVNSSCKAYGSTMTMAERDMTCEEIAAMDAMFERLNRGREAA